MKKGGTAKPCSRRRFLGTMGRSAASLYVAPHILFENGMLSTRPDKEQYTTQVALTSHDNYNRALIKQRVAHLFDSIGGISDVAGSGDKVAVKINLTGGSYWVGQLAGSGIDITECMWTHPEVVRAVCELLIDSGVSANNIVLVEALWDAESYNDYGYLGVQQDLGIQMIDLATNAPYADYMQLSVPDGYYYADFTVNGILDEVDAYISIPKTVSYTHLTLPTN